MNLHSGVSNHINQFNLLHTDDLKQIDDLVQIQTFRKGDLLIREGDVCQRLYFIRSGILRSFFTKPNGEEVTYCLTFGQNLMTALSSYISREPTHENLQALSPVEVEVLDKNKLQALMQDNIHWQKLEKALISEQYIELEKRMLTIQRLDAKERYEDLVNQHAELIRHIPLKYLASFLNITPRHLTRLRNEK